MSCPVFHIDSRALSTGQDFARATDGVKTMDDTLFKLALRLEIMGEIPLHKTREERIAAAEAWLESI